jgi:hypothetical protein
VVFPLAIAAFLFNALDAYSVYDVPISWVGSVIPFIGFIFCGVKSYALRLSSGFIILLCFLTLVTIWNCSFGDYERLMPSKYAGTYESFIALRFVNYIAFILYTCILTEVFTSGYLRKFAKSISVIACLIAIYSFYVYAAQLFGLPEVPRTRLGTGGEAQATMFTYDFHRAMGTFREPSHMASWMVVMLFFPLICWSGLRAVFALSLIVGAIVLSGSLSAFLALLVVAVIFAILQFGSLRLTSFPSIIRGAIVISVSLGIFYLFSFVYESGESGSYFSTMWDRIAPVFASQDALMTTNRSYIYKWVGEEGGIPILGYGLGNSNLVLSAAFGGDLVYSFLNLFLNILYSGGMIGLLLLAWAYLKPAIDLLKNNQVLWSRDLVVFSAMGTYISMTVFFMGSKEEFSLLFSIPIALMLALKNGPIPSDVQMRKIIQ